MNFKENWRVITHDQWILQVVCPLVFLKQPPLRTPHVTSQTHQLTKEQHHYGGGSRESPGETSYPSGSHQIRISRFLQHDLCSPKEGWGWRPIINLKSLNQYLEVPHFKMESIQSLKDVRLSSQDRPKGCLPVGSDECPSSPYLHFTWREDVFEFSSLPFGLAPAPLIFTKRL